MIEMNSELIAAMRKFKDFFGDVVPLRELPQNVTNDVVIEAIYSSIDKNVNLLPERFGYKELEGDKNILM